MASCKILENFNDVVKKRMLNKMASCKIAKNFKTIGQSIILFGRELEVCHTSASQHGSLISPEDLIRGHAGWKFSDFVFIWVDKVRTYKASDNISHRLPTLITTNNLNAGHSNGFLNGPFRPPCSLVDKAPGRLESSTLFGLLCYQATGEAVFIVQMYMPLTATIPARRPINVKRPSRLEPQTFHNRDVCPHHTESNALPTELRDR